MTATASAVRPRVRSTPSPPRPNRVTSRPVRPRGRRGRGTSSVGGMGFAPYTTNLVAVSARGSIIPHGPAERRTGQAERGAGCLPHGQGNGLLIEEQATEDGVEA